QLDLEILGDLVGDTRMQRPRQMPFAGIAAEAEAAVRIDVVEIAQRVVGAADTDADERREAVPGAEIYIGIAEEDPGFQIALVLVDAVRRIGDERIDA